ncbi:MAG: RNA-binding S4 domain-containing protein [Candidatus Cloacimonetes bacterium]|nr:RNA-binding S4 domain-containing protein [Candidatus Cloacimonadota bacterium]MCF7813241.1 RNA-binding S4 domain-containing protein [Candidatus Cloacimonadota bacterium]MCF7867440.1 RNA-binding S4 domain-containing protein [Candidatus Cloacimonadota bacterium]MCF7882928.1 RNA-binding S4 domain-containing protein [Candidatus Cloacimonadota bacterium]
MKFWIDKDGFIYLFQALKAAGAIPTYKEVSFAIKRGQVMVNDETSFKQRHVLKGGDTVKYKRLHMKIMERDDLGRTKKDILRETEPEGNVRHGNLKGWKAKPLIKEINIDTELAETSRKVHELLTKKELTLSLAESCTGGMIQEIITQYSGSSLYFMGGITSYADSAKIKILHVKRDTLKKHGAVSEETAIEMATNCAEIFQSTIAGSVTGIAGPTGGSKNKPVGTVHIALYIDGKVIQTKYVFSGDREMIRKKSTHTLFKLILENI